MKTQHVLTLTLLILLVGCAHGKFRDIPEAPDPDIQEVYYSEPCIIQIGVVERPEMPEYPQWRDDFTVEERKAWAADVRAVTKETIARLNAYIDALLSQMEEHNRLEPKCEQ